MNEPETTPYSLQAPEQIAKDYGGNKQRIAEAAQMGLVDPTAAVLAGMFIDRIRSAQALEQAPQGTIAQQVFAPPAPPPQMAPPQGLGGTPQAMDPAMQMAAQVTAQAAPMGPPPQAGLSAIPPSPDYADGGLVAFAAGGSGYDAFKRAIIGQESNGRYGVANAEGSGAMGIGQIMPATAAALARRLGLPYSPELLAGTSDEARAYQDKLTEAAVREAWDYGKGDISQASAYYFAGPNKKGWGEKTRKYQSDIARRLGRDTGESRSEQSQAQAGDSDVFSSEGRAADYKGLVDLVGGLMPSSADDPVQQELLAALRAQEDPEALKADKERDMWETLAQIGFGMAASDSPHLLQSFGQAAAGALPGARASRKERESKKMAALKERAAIAAGNVAEKRDNVKTGLDLGKEGQRIELSEKQLKQQRELQEAEIAARADLEKDQAAVQREIAAMNQGEDQRLIEGFYSRLKAQYPSMDDGRLRMWAAAAAYRYKKATDAEFATARASAFPVPIVSQSQAPGANILNQNQGQVPGAVTPNAGPVPGWGQPRIAQR